MPFSCLRNICASVPRIPGTPQGAMAILLEAEQATYKNQKTCKQVTCFCLQDLASQTNRKIPIHRVGPQLRNVAEGFIGSLYIVLKSTMSRHLNQPELIADKPNMTMYASHLRADGFNHGQHMLNHWDVWDRHAWINQHC